MQNNLLAPRKRKGRSICWDFYVGPPDSNLATIQCPVCMKNFNYSGSTTVLVGHLKRHHEEIYNRLVNGKKFKSSGCVFSNEEATHTLAKSFSTGLIAFRFAENPEFRSFLNMINPSFKAPSQKKLKDITQLLASNYEEKLKGQLSNIKAFTVITDGFSDFKKNYHFYSLHISSVDSEFNRKMNFCTLKSVEKGDSDSIAAALTLSLHKSGLLFSNCSAITSDAASPLVLLAEKQGIERIHCSCHVLNLVIESFSKEKSVHKIYAKVQSFARFLGRRKSTRSNLKSIASSLGIHEPLPLTLSPTRWAGLHILLERFLANYPAAKDLADLKPYLLRTTELDTIREIVQLLKPIHQGILKMERENSYASEILPTMVFILKKNENNDRPLAVHLNSCLTARLNACVTNPRLLSSMLIDYRFAYSDMYSTYFDWDDVEGYVARYDDSPPAPSTTSSSDDNFMDLDSFFNSSASSSDSSNNVQAELLQYKAFITSNRPKNLDPLEFWKSQQNNFPRLSLIAAQLLSSPASSAVSERLFSRCSDFVRQKKRNRATLETLNSILQVSEISRLERDLATNAEESDSGNISDSDASSDSDIEDPAIPPPNESPESESSDED